MRITLAIATTLALALPALAQAQEMDRQIATGSCMLFIKKILHDPGSASFGHSKEASVTIKGNRAFVVRSVRATNAFGAKRLQEYMCFVESQGKNVLPVLITPRNENQDKAEALLKLWGMP